ncbi:MAG: MerR family transcriptional regulator [Thermoleophilia bacterium]|nr:MerR family transcriptional regulator [Thermoleophilia bacterium]
MSGGWYLIGIAAEMAGMHPQTLRVYERRGLVRPSRSAGNTRRYSPEDVALLCRIQELSEQGLNLAGIERVLELERRAEAAERRVRELEAECAAKDARAREEIDRVRRAGRAELVRVVQTPADLVPMYRPIVTRKGTR